MGKKDFLWCPILMIATGGLFWYVVFVDSLLLLFISGKKFQMLCQVKKRNLERYILQLTVDQLDKACLDIGIVLPEGDYSDTGKLDVKPVRKYDISYYYSDEYKEELKRMEEEKNNNVSDIQLELDTVAENYVNDDSMDSEEHEHIKEDPYLSEKINKAQDRLARYQSNDYFPSVSKPTYKDINARRKELKEELKAGLISKEDYEEMLRELR